jgi:hypothetical protein
MIVVHLFPSSFFDALPTVIVRLTILFSHGEAVMLFLHAPGGVSYCVQIFFPRVLLLSRPKVSSLIFREERALGCIIWLLVPSSIPILSPPTPQP